MATTTPNYSLQKPAIGADTDAWGAMLNGDMDILDAQLDLVSDRVAAIEVGGQTPWKQNIDGANFRLDNVLGIGLGVADATPGRMRIVSAAAGAQIRCENTANDSLSAISLNAAGGGNLIISARGDAHAATTTRKHAVVESIFDLIFTSAAGERARINATGLGVGVTPTVPLHVIGHVNREIARFAASTDSTGLRSYVAIGTPNPAHWTELSNEDVNGNSSNTGLAIRMRSGADPSTRIAYFGHLGELIVAPIGFGPTADKFQVSGSAYVSGTATIIGNVGIGAAPDPAATGPRLTINRADGNFPFLQLLNSHTGAGHRGSYIHFSNSAQAWRIGIGTGGGNDPALNVQDGISGVQVLTALPGSSPLVTIKDRLVVGAGSDVWGVFNAYGSKGTVEAGINLTCVARFSGNANSVILFDTLGAVNPTGYRRGIMWSFQLDDFSIGRFANDGVTAHINDVYIAANGHVNIGGGVSTSAVTKLSLFNLPGFASRAAALAAGLTLGNCYTVPSGDGYVIGII